MHGMELFIVHIVTIVILYAVFDSIDKHNDKEMMKSLTKEHVVLKYPKAYIWVGVFIILFSSTLLFFMIFYPNGTEALWVFILFGLVDLSGIAMALNALMWRIDVFKSENYFLYRQLFKTYKIEYNNCSWVKFKNFNITVKTDKRTLHLEVFITNIDSLTFMLHKYGVKEIDEETNNKKKKK